MFSGKMGPRASKDVFTAYSAIAGTAENDLKMADFVFCTAVQLYGDFGHF